MVTIAQKRMEDSLKNLFYFLQKCTHRITFTHCLQSIF